MSKAAGLNQKTFESLAALSRHATGALQLLQVQIDAVEEDPDNPRQHFDPQALSELADSIRAQGLIQPVTVRELAPNRFMLVDGARRLRASKLAGLVTVPAIRHSAIAHVATVQLVANEQRESLTALETGRVLKRAMAEDPSRFPTIAKLAKHIGRSKAWVSKHLSVIEVGVDVAYLAESGRVTTVERLLELNALPDEARVRAVAAIGAGVAYKDALRVDAAAPACAESPRTKQRPLPDNAVRRVHQLAAAAGFPTPVVKPGSNGIVVVFSLTEAQLAELLRKHA